MSETATATMKHTISAAARELCSARSAIAAIIACAAGVSVSAEAAVPILPQAAGYGIETVAGRGGTVHRVTNLNDSGAGSLRACVTASGPRVCVFEVSGTIKMATDLSITNPRITIAGQTAPSPGIMLRGAALRISTSDVLVQHLRVRPGDDAAGPTPSNRDSLKIESPPEKPIKNIVIDHCSFSWAVDEVASVWRGFDNVTLSNNIFSEGLYQSLLPDGVTGGYGLIVGQWDGKVAIIGNLLAHNKERNPLSRATHAAIVNNVVYNRANMDVDLQSHGLATNTSVIGNVFIRGADYARDNKPVLIRTEGDLALPPQSKVYVSDNASLERATGDEWSVVGASGGSLPGALKSALPPTWPAGLTRLSTQSDVVLSSVLKNAGARPADRDSVDKRVVQSVRDGTGRIINCVAADGSERCKKNAGGWPKLAENRRALTLPANHSTVTASGYTNLELWLQKMSAEVEGRSEHSPSAPVLSSQSR